MRFGKIYVNDRMGNKTESNEAKSAKKAAKSKTSQSVAKEPIAVEKSTQLKIPQNTSKPMETARNAESEMDISALNQTQSDISGLNNINTDDHSEFCDDADLCEACKWREAQLQLAAAKNAELRHKQLSEEEAMMTFRRARNDEAEKNEQEAIKKRRELEVEIRELNKHLMDEKRKQTEPQHSGGYLLYKRPDTASINRAKQQSLFEDLSKQVDEKRESELRSRSIAASETSRVTAEKTQSEILNEEVVRKMKDVRKKEEYKKDLDNQIAAKLLSDPLTSSGKLEPWWYKATDVTGRPVDDQNKRLQQQEQAIKNLEDFLARQKAEAEARKAAESELRKQINSTARSVAASEPNILPMKSAAERQAIMADTQKKVEDAWRQAHSNSDYRAEILQNDLGGSIEEQMKKYRRCKKCHKSMGGNGKDTSAMPTVRFKEDPRLSQSLMSRHLTYI